MHGAAAGPGVAQEQGWMSRGPSRGIYPVSCGPSLSWPLALSLAALSRMADGFRSGIDRDPWHHLRRTWPEAAKPSLMTFFVHAFFGCLRTTPWTLRLCHVCMCHLIFTSPRRPPPNPRIECAPARLRDGIETCQCWPRLPPSVGCFAEVWGSPLPQLIVGETDLEISLTTRSPRFGVALARLERFWRRQGLRGRFRAPLPRLLA